MKRLLIALSTRRCHGCTDSSYHTHHLTTIGRWRYSWRYRLDTLIDSAWQHALGNGRTRT